MYVDSSSPLAQIGGEHPDLVVRTCTYIPLLPQDGFHGPEDPLGASPGTPSYLNRSHAQTVRPPATKAVCFLPTPRSNSAFLLSMVQLLSRAQVQEMGGLRCPIAYLWHSRCSPTPFGESEIGGPVCMA